MRTPLRALTAACLAALGALLPSTSRADQLYGVTFLDNQLITIDTATGAGSLVGPLDGNVAPFGLVNSDNRLLTFDSTTSQIRRIDPSSGGTLATFDTGIGTVLGQGGLAFQTSTVGFVTSALDPSTFDVVNDLFRFDIATGTSMLVGHTSQTLEALAFDPAGVLYALGKLDGDLYTVDPTTAAITLVGNTGVSVGSPTGALAFDSAGTLFATLDDKLYTLNTATGAATPVGSADPLSYTGFSSISGIASVRAVPEPGSALLLVLGLGGLAAAARRRR